MKVRKPGQNTLEEIASKDLKKELEQKEAEHRANEAKKKQVEALNQPQLIEEFSKPKIEKSIDADDSDDSDDSSDSEKEEVPKQKAEKKDSDSDSDSDSSDDEDDEEALKKELERLRKIKEEEEIRRVTLHPTYFL
jgi:hypothetical protein